MIKYSIITPVFNRADCVSRCIESVIRNLSSGVEIEHVIIDDGSADDTPNIVKSYSDKYQHIKFHRFSENRGTNAARNKAIEMATGDFCIILDSDDYFVDNAIQIIDSVISNNPKYREFMFAADDMVEYYQANAVLSGKEYVELSFRNFLRREIGGDFIHCVNTAIMKKYPFDESLRIYEGVFFLRFYRESQLMLFANKVVTIRERSRSDSVTRTVIASNKATIQKHYKANLISYNWFYNDYVKFEESNALCDLLNNLLYFSLLLQDRDNSFKWRNELLKSKMTVTKRNNILFKYRLGGVMRCLLIVYFTIKYNVLKSRLN